MALSAVLEGPPCTWSGFSPEIESSEGEMIVYPEKTVVNVDVVRVVLGRQRWR